MFFFVNFELFWAFCVLASFWTVLERFDLSGTVCPLLCQIKQGQSALLELNLKVINHLATFYRFCDIFISKTYNSVVLTPFYHFLPKQTSKLVLNTPKETTGNPLCLKYPYLAEQRNKRYTRWSLVIFIRVFLSIMRYFRSFGAWVTPKNIFFQNKSYFLFF